MKTSLRSGYHSLLLSITLLLGLAMPLAAQTLTWTNVTPMNTARINAAAVVLNDGKVLVTGGPDSTAERYDPVAGTWTTINMVSARWLHRAEKLADGRVLVIAGAVSGTRNALNTAEIYDPATGTFSAVANLAESRETFASTVLSNGKVLVHGGWNGSSVRSSGEVYDPATNTWTATGASVPRNSHELVTLPNGKVLMISGHTGAVHGPQECYLYDPAANTWAATGSMGTGRANPRSVVLANGKVLTTGESATCELYDPALGTWSYTGSMSVGRGQGHAILLGDGRVLSYGGVGSYPAMPVSSEIYDPAAGSWSATGSAASGRVYGVAARLQNGVVLAAGGNVGTNVFSAPASANVAIFDAPPPPPAPTVASISPSVGSTTGGTVVTITGTNLTGATGVTIGGAAAPITAITDTEITATTPAGTAGTASVLVTTPGGTNAANTLFTYQVPPSLTWTNATSMNTARVTAAAVVLDDGKVLVTGGRDASNTALNTAELYDPVAGSWTNTDNMTTARWLHKMEKLSDGRVLVMGGRVGGASTEIYNPATGTFTAGPNMAFGRDDAATVVLADGRVLNHGGWNGATQGEIYNPATNTWTSIATSVPRITHELLLLPDGRVLMIGSFTGGVVDTTTYLYDPVANTWTASGALAMTRYNTRSVLLAGGKILTTTAPIDGGNTSTCELYDIATGTWSYTGSSSVFHGRHHVGTLGDGRVVAIAGGTSAMSIYNPATGTWATGSPLSTSRQDGIVVKLLNGKFLAAGGYNGSATINTVEIFDGPPPPPLPTVTSSTANLASNATTITITGTSFDTTPGNNTVVFSNGAVGTVTSASATSLTVTFSTQPTSFGNLTAVVTNGNGSSGPPVQVASVSNIIATLSGGTLTITDVANGNDTLSLSQSAGDLVITADVASVIGSNAGTGSGTNSVSIPLIDITGLITVNAAGGTDIINVGDILTPLSGLTVNGGTGDDTVNLNGDITFPANASLDLDLQNDDPTPGLDAVNVGANANLLTSGTGAITVKASKNVAMATGSSFETVNGGITVEANQQTIPTSAAFIGVQVSGSGALVRSTGTGQVTVKGRGGNSSAATQPGVSVTSGGKILGGTSGTVLVEGRGGPSSVSTAGVQVSGTGASISSAGASVTVTGFGGGSGTASVNIGIYVLSAASISAGGAGDVTVSGTGGNTTGTFNEGVLVTGVGSTVTSTSGNVIVTGSGGSGTGNCRGVDLFFEAVVAAGGGGNVTVTGVGGPGTGSSNHGVILFNNSNTNGTRISTTTGNLAVTGTAGPNSTGIRNLDNSLITTVDGTITVTGYAGSGTAAVNIANNATGGGRLTVTGTGSATVAGDMQSFDSTAVINLGTRPLTLKPTTVGRVINIGGADVLATTLGLTDAELDAVTAGTLNIGDSASGNITFSDAISSASVPLVNLITGGSITNANASGNTLTVTNSTTSGTLAPGASPGIFSVAGNHSLVAGSTFSVEIGGTTVGTQYDQLSATGTVEIGANVTLSTSSFGGFTPSIGQVYTIISRTGGTGTFAGLAEGAVISTDFLGSGLPARISYVGGSGNDVVISTANPEIQIEQPLANILVDGTSTVGFGSVGVGGNLPKTFTITNVGTSDLSLGAVMPSGAGFSVDTTGMSNLLAANASTTFIVTFTPGAAGPFSGTIQVGSSDEDENPFDISLSGTGVLALPLESPAVLGAQAPGLDPGIVFRALPETQNSRRI